jgi:hypothetical protein
MFLNQKRPCDTCIFMADSCHPELCLHPLRQNKGKLGQMIEDALLWNGNCSVYIKGDPAFHTLIDLDLEPKALWKCSEQVQQELTQRFNETGEVTAGDLAEALQMSIPV